MKNIVLVYDHTNSSVKMAYTTTKVATGSFVWVEDPKEAWIDGEVIEINGENITIQCSSGKTIIVKASNTHQKDMEVPASGVNDMTKLANLHEPGVLHNLKSRYDINEIYTYIGNILIAVNPFKELLHLYTNHMMAQYKGATFGELSPHLFAVADTAYRQMTNEGINQSILVSGESGAGKTESTKWLMQYLTYVGGRVDSNGERTVEKQVLESNPVLEAFGNAKTVRNNNSSRFGKFVEIQFDQRGRISGAAIRTYLLERSRVCQVSDPERNYHCFYMLCAAPSEDIRKLQLADPRSFRYLNQSSCIELEGIDDSKGYLTTRKAMDIVGISLEEQEAIFRVVAAILHLGNIEFTNGKEPDSSIPKDEKSKHHLKIAAELFMCNEQAMEDSLCKRVMVTPDETISRCLDPESAALSRDALAKIVYSRLFDWIVNKINNSIGQDPNSKNLIGVLDIYGFESFNKNSFEQFCINLTNEKLQQHFNQHVFKMEQEEYKKEEIDWSYIDFVDNQNVLDLIEKKPGGIIALLDEACMVRRSTHETFSQNLYSTLKNHKCFSKPKLSPTDFTISHYAGDVTYQTEQFLDKNKDYVVAEHQDLLSASKCTFVASLFPILMEDANKQSKFASIGSQFKLQLASLLEILSTTEPHYIRCVKPNNLLKPSIFENANILQQLRCGGVMEAIRINRAGFPTRKHFDEFLDRFGIIASVNSDKSCDEIAACKRLLENVGLEGYQIGKTKVFLRAGQMAELDARRTETLGRSASIIQRKFRSYMSCKSFIMLRKSAISMQTICRGEIARHIFKSLRREASALKIQRNLRMYLAMKSYKGLCYVAVTIQSSLRSMVARNVLHIERQTIATIVIQSCCRGFLANFRYEKLKKATITTQSSWRRRLARKELRVLKMAARETGVLQAAKNHLQKQVEDLTLRLQIEKRMRVDVEERKAQENAKLQLELEEMKLQFNETKASLLKEVEDAKKTAKITPLVHEIPVVDTELVKKLASENKTLKSLVSSLESKIDETERKFAETSRISEERLKQALEAEKKIINLKTSMHLLEEKLLDIESENKFLKQSLINSPVKETSGHVLHTPVKNLESDTKSRRSQIDPKHEDVELLLESVRNNIGFNHEKPVAAFTIYKCFLHWKSFEAEKTNVFDRLVQLIGSKIQNEDDNAQLSYWLCNTSTLLFLIQQSLKSNTTKDSPYRKSPFGGWMSKSFRSSADMATTVIRVVNAQHPALFFKQQLSAYVEKIYGILRDNLKKEVGTLLNHCIKAGRLIGKDSPLNHWKGIIEALDAMLSTLQDNFVPMILIQKIFTQTFSFINVQLFNSLVMRPDNCSFSNGEYMKSGLAELDKWCSQNDGKFGSLSWEELKHIRQAVEFLVIHQKYTISYDEIANYLCPILSIQQHFKLCTLYKDEIYNTKSVSQDVISSMTSLMSDSKDFLLNDDSNDIIPFSVDDLSKSIKDKDFAEVKPAQELLQNPSFSFLI